MSDIPSRYPYLDSFLGSQFIQNPDDHRSLEEITEDFRATSWPDDVAATATDIRLFLKEQHNDVASAFDGFNPQIFPPGMGYTTTEFLSKVAELLERPQNM